MKQSEGCAKQMIASYLRSTGYLCSVTLETKKTITADYYLLANNVVNHSEKQIELHQGSAS